MKICENGVYREMTKEEIEEISNKIIPEENQETIEDRLDKLENFFNKIADNLGISEKTVRNHISNVIQKLGVKGRSQAILELIRIGELTLEK